MASTFGGLEIGARALTASQIALNVTGQNTANVGTPGYSRQVVNLEETDPYGGPGINTSKPSPLGTGVSVASITRVRDDFLDKQTFSANADQGALNTLSDIAGRVESVYGEPSTDGLGSQLTAFFNSFSDLASTPDSGAARSTVINSAQSVIDAFHTVSSGLSALNPELQSRITADVGSVNDLAAQIAALNQQIGPAVQNGDQPNDLLDKRTALIGQLSSLAGVQVIDGKNGQTGQPSGQVEINIGGFSLVQDGSSNALPATVSTVNGQPALTTAGGQNIPLKSGELSGLIRATSLIKGYQSGLDTLAANVISSVNTLHAAGAGLDGVTGRNFFTGTGAADIGLSPQIAGNTDAIAAATAPAPGASVAPGNGDNATALAALVSQPVIGSASLNQFYNAQIAGIAPIRSGFRRRRTRRPKSSRSFRTSSRPSPGSIWTRS